MRLVSGFPGATLAIVLPRGKTVRLATGTTVDYGNAAMPPTARMFTGSAGKTFVAAIVLQLAAEGRLSLDEKVGRYFAADDWFARLPNANQLTIRRLLNHTGGLPRYIDQAEFWEEVMAAPARIWKPTELLAHVFDNEPVHPPGAGWYYSDTDYILLGMIIERVCDATYYSELQRRILDPWGLALTTPSRGRTIDGLVPGMSGKAPPIELPEQVLVDGRYIFDPQFEWTGGGLVSNVGDLAAWAKLLYEGEIIPGEWLRKMLAPVSTETGLPSTTGYGLGVFVKDSSWGPMHGHGGIFPGYRTQMDYVPRLRCAIALQTNADSFSGRLPISLQEMVDELLSIGARYLDR